MFARQRVNKRIDKRIFTKTASRTRASNVPGRIMQRGGIRL